LLTRDAQRGGGLARGGVIRGEIKFAQSV
jgi:hypothetical protein